LDALLILGIKNGIGRHTSSATITGVGNSLKVLKNAILDTSTVLTKMPSSLFSSWKSSMFFSLVS
jgi:hypothetical protein